MGFFDKLGANLTNAGRTVSQSAKNFSESTALQKEMNAEKRNIQQKFAEIGELYYEKYNMDPAADFFEQMESISASTRRIEDLQQEIAEVQARKAELVPIPETPSHPTSVKPSAMVCMQCGQTFDTTKIYCDNCGQKLTPQYPTAAAAALAPNQTANDVRSASGKPTEIPAAFMEETIRSESAGTSAPPKPEAPKNDAPKDDAPVNEASNTDAPEEKPDSIDPPAPADPNAPKFCTNCGAKVPNDSNFCPLCGNKLS